MEDAKLQFWKTWGFWGLILIIGQIPFPLNPIAILFSPLGIIYDFRLRTITVAIGLILCVIGLFRDGKSKWWAIVGVALLFVFAVLAYVALSRF